MKPELKAQVLDVVRNAVEDLYKVDIRLDVDREKVVQYAQARRNELYYRGQQYVYEVLRDGQVVDYTSTGQIRSNSGETGYDGGRAYDYVLNYIRGDGDKYVAILGQKSPTVKAQPNRRDDDSQTRLARKADTVADCLRANWDMDFAQQALALSLWKNGTTFLYTPFVSSAERYGVTHVPNIEMRQIPISDPYFACAYCGAHNGVQESQQFGTCGQCNSPLKPEDFRDAEYAEVPEVMSTTPYANGAVELHVCSIMTVSTPFYVKNVDHTCPWLWYEYEEHKGVLLNTYRKGTPQGDGLREVLQNDTYGSADSSTSAAAGRLTRDIASSPTGTSYAPRKNRWTYTRYWLNPAMIEIIGDDRDSNGQVRDLMYKYFAGGAKVTAVNGHLIDIEEERMDEVWVACKPRASEYLYADAGCQDYLGPQDLINDYQNTMKEMADRNIPITFYHPQIIDPAILNQHRATPMEFIPYVPGFGSPKDSMWNSPTVTLNPQISAWVEGVGAAARQITGILPSIFGGDSGVQKTARQAEMDRNQGLMQLSLPWNQMRRAIAKAFENGVVQLAKYSNGRIVSRRSSNVPVDVSEIPDISDLLQGGWHFKAEEAMPMTWGQRRDTWWSLIETGNPQVWQMVGMDDPENLTVLQEVMGMADWKVPMLDSLYKVHDTIRELLNGAPVQQMTPTGTQLLPSVPVDEFEDDHAFAVAVVKMWAQTERALAVRRSNPDGYANVIAWGKQHFMLSQPPMLPQGGPPPPGGGDGQQQPQGDMGPQPPQTPDGSVPQAPPPDVGSVPMSGAPALQ